MISTDPRHRIESTGRLRLLVQTLASVGGGVVFALALIAAQRGAARPDTLRHIGPTADSALSQATPSATPAATFSPQPTAQVATTVYLVASDAQAAVVQQSWEDARLQRQQLSGTPRTRS